MRLLFFFLFVSLSALTAQSVFPLYPEIPPCFNGRTDKVHHDSLIATVVTDVAIPVLHHFAPVPRMATGGAVVIAPGGGYWVQAWDLEGVDIARRMAASGIDAFVLRYRLPALESGGCKSKVAQRDAQRALQLVRFLADSLSIKPDHIAIMGFSAGGHLAGSASVHHLLADIKSSDPVARFSSRPNRSILVYPVLIMDEAEGGHSGSQRALLGENPDPEEMNYYNLPGQVSSATPPTLLVHASDDRAVPVQNSLRYYEALVQNGIPADLRVFATGGHGFGSANRVNGPLRHWLEEVILWLQTAGW